MTRQLLKIAAVLEWGAGLGLMAVPGLAIALLLGSPPDAAGVMIARVAGAALCALGLACWGARTSAAPAAYLGTLRAITFYNACAGLLLTWFAVTGQAGGFVIWSAAALHLGLGVVFAMCLRRPETT